MREVCRTQGVGGRWLRKRREGGKDHCGVKFLCNTSLCVLPHGRLCLVRCTGVRCVQLLFKLCLWTKKGEKREKEKWKTSQWRQYWRVFSSLALALKGLLPGLGLWPKTVPCVPQMGLLNMKGHNVQMANFAWAQLKDKWPNLLKTEILQICLILRQRTQ